MVALLDRAPEGRKGGSLMRIFGRWWALYQAVAFVALIPIMSYYVITHSLPKKILLICIPGYAVLAVGSYMNFKRASNSK